MPQITCYVSEELYKKLIEAGDTKSHIIQKALNKYFKEGDK